jgi:hypothetical protein
MARTVCKNLTELAAALGVSRPAVSKRASSPGWRWGKGPFTAAQVREIRADQRDRRAMNPAGDGRGHDADDDADAGKTLDQALAELRASPERSAKIKLIVARTGKIELEKALLAGQYVKLEEVESGRVARVRAVRAKLQEIAARSPLIANKSEIDAETLLTGWMREACECFADGKGIDD